MFKEEIIHFLVDFHDIPPWAITLTPFSRGLRASIFDGKLVNYFTTCHPCDLTLQDMVDMGDGVVTFIGDERWIEDMPPECVLVSRDLKRQIYPRVK